MSLIDWRTIDLKCNEIPKEVLEIQKSVQVSEGTKDMGLGLKVFYREALPADGREPLVTLVLLHGRMFSSKTWLELGTIQIVAAMGYRVVAIDIPGYGNSPSTIISDKAMFVKVILDSFTVTNPVIVSPSLSGLFTLPFLLKYKEILTGYIPVAPVGIEVLQGLPPIKKDIFNETIEHVYGPLREFLKYPLPDLSHIETPTMVVFGEKDRSVSSAVLSLLPNSQSQEIPNGNHPAYLDDPELWHKLIYNFLHHLSEQKKV